MTKDYGAVYKSRKDLKQPPKRPKMRDEKLPLLDSDHLSDSSEQTQYPTGGASLIDMDNIATYSSDDNIGGDPFLERKLEHPTSNFDTMVHLLKGNIGTGILAMPDAFRNAGWVVGLFGTLIIGALCTHCMHMLVGCAHELCKRTQRPSLDFSQVVECAFETGPKALQKHASLVRKLVNIFLVLTQLGFCCVYFVFVAVNIHDVIKHYFFDMSLHWYLLLLLGPLILLNLVKSLKYLTPASLFASILTCTGLMITFFYMLQGLPNTKTIQPFAPIENLPLYFGTAIYAFEGIGVVLPLENNMKTPQDFGGWNGVLNTGMVVVATLYTAVGFFGYLKYGDDARLGSVTLLLPPDEILAQSVRLMMAIAIFLSYSLQFYVPMQILWPYCQKHLTTDKSRKLGDYALRIVLVFFTFGLAVAIPNLGAVISLVGAFSSSALALIFPPIIEIVTFWPDKLGKNNWILLKDLAIVCFGFVGFAIGSYINRKQFIVPFIEDTPAASRSTPAQSPSPERKNCTSSCTSSATTTTALAQNVHRAPVPPESPTSPQRDR